MDAAGDPPSLPEGFGALGPAVVTPPPGPAAQALARRLAVVESRNVTFLDPEALPVFWTEARGANVRDADGNRYLDLTGAFGVGLAGHAHPRVRAALHAQGERLLHGMGDVHPPEVKVRLLERLAALAPWPETRGFLANAGSEAVEAALKTALLATGRPGILAFEGGYHGLTLGSLAATHREDFRAPFAPHLHGGVRFAPFPDVLGPPPWAVPGGAAEAAVGEAATAEPAMAEDLEADRGAVRAAVEAALEAVEAALEAGARAGLPVGAVLIEPVQGRAGVRVPPPGFLAGVAERARAAGALVIHDEIFCGLGRTGRTWASAWDGEAARPDLLCIGKALGGGLPVSALLGEAAVMEAWPISRGEALHTSTFLGHPLAAATALAFLDVLEEEALPARALALGETLRTGLEAALADNPPPGYRGVRGRGAFLGIVLDRENAPPAAGVRVAGEALRRGVILLPAGPCGEVVELSPSAFLTPGQVEVALELVVEAIRAACRSR